MIDSERTNELLTEIREELSELIGVMRGIEGIVDEQDTTLGMIEASVGTLAYRSLPWWTRVRLAWRHDREVLRATEAEQGGPQPFRTTDGT